MFFCLLCLVLTVFVSIKRSAEQQFPRSVCPKATTPWSYSTIVLFSVLSVLYLRSLWKRKKLKTAVLPIFLVRLVNAVCETWSVSKMFQSLRQKTNFKQSRKQTLTGTWNFFVWYRQNTNLFSLLHVPITGYQICTKVCALFCDLPSLSHSNWVKRANYTIFGFRDSRLCSTGAERRLTIPIRQIEMFVCIFCLSVCFYFSSEEHERNVTFIRVIVTPKQLQFTRLLTMAWQRTTEPVLHRSLYRSLQDPRSIVAQSDAIGMGINACIGSMVERGKFLTTRAVPDSAPYLRTSWEA